MVFIGSKERVPDRDGRARPARVVGIPAIALATALAAGPSLAAQDAPLASCPPVEGFVEISAGRVQYLDWGGQGPVIVLLAGLGNTAHVFDALAPRLTDAFRVVGLTRRGFGTSAHPDAGYDTDTLAHDLEEALDALRHERVHLVGHSLAGDEMTRFAGRRPDRVERLVYLDAAYDRAAMRKLLAMSLFTNPKPPAPPRASKRDKASVQAYGDYVERVHGVRWPEAEVRASGGFDRDGRSARTGASPKALASVLLGSKPPDYRAVRASALALYAIQDSVQEAYPWLRAGRGVDTVHAAIAAATGKPVPVPTLNAWNWLSGRWRPFVRDQEEKFAAEMADGTVREIHGPHYVFLSHPDEVAEAIRAFLTSDADPSVSAR